MAGKACLHIRNKIVDFTGAGCGFAMAVGA